MSDVPHGPDFNAEVSGPTPEEAARLELEVAFAGLTHVVRLATSAGHPDRSRMFDTLTALNQRYGDVSTLVSMVSREPDTQRIGHHAGYLGIWVDTDIKRLVDGDQ
jgi:hypothetical protein